MDNSRILVACLLSGMLTAAQAEAPTAIVHTSTLPTLPTPVSNNAVASVTANNRQYLISFAGIGSGRAHGDVHARTFVLAESATSWSEVAPVPGRSGRLAATAVTVGELAHVFGGYTLAVDGTEVSTPWVHAFDPVTSTFTELAPMPIPVDDAVSVSYANRYIYLISGWHDLGSVNLVQRYDTHTDTWAQATPLPGKSLFGHAGVIVENKMFYCDGVTVLAHSDQQRSFVASNECYLGQIDVVDSRRIDWRAVPAHPGAPRYRMAAAGIPKLNAVVFLGGSENPYNYNGIGYNGVPSEPARSAMFFDLGKRRWRTLILEGVSSMDHRGLVPLAELWVTVGGMRAEQLVTDKVVGYGF